MSEETYRIYLGIKPYLEDHAREWEEETGLGKDLIEDARLEIADIALNDFYNAEVAMDNIAQLEELITELEGREDDMVKLTANPMGGWNIEDAMEEE